MRPGLGWRLARRFCQALGLLIIVAAPLLGGWQRTDRADLGSWDGQGWDLPAALREALPGGDAPAQVYEASQLLGGGGAVSLLGVGVVDPVAGAVAVITGPVGWTSALAWLLPLLFAALFGRWFCGWLCPYGTIARALERVLARLPWRPKRRAVPVRRPVRWVLLVGLIVSGLAGAQAGVVLLLPHLALQQTAYGAWLMGGLGAIGGWLLALLAAGALFGPTTWCAAICPTGAALSLPGRVSGRPIRLAALEPTACGARCDLCVRACWIQLDPGSGDPGPDCDLCGRCVPACPRTNLGLTRAAHLGALLLLVLPAGARAEAEPRPRLVLAAEQAVGAFTATLEVVDLTAVRLDADDRRAEGGAEIRFFAARGALQTPDHDGRIPRRETYTASLTVRVFGPDEALRSTHVLDAPNWPQSTGRRGLYRVRLSEVPEPGDIIEVELGGVTSTWTIDTSTPGGGQRWAPGFAVGLLVAVGLLLLALVAGPPRAQPARLRA